MSSFVIHRYTEDGHCKGPVSERELRPIRLQWDIPSDCLDVMESSLRVAQAIAADVDLHIQVYCSAVISTLMSCSSLYPTNSACFLLLPYGMKIYMEVNLAAWLGLVKFTEFNVSKF